MKPDTIVQKRHRLKADSDAQYDRETTLTIDGIGALNLGPLPRISPLVILEAAAGNIVLREKGKGFAPPPTDTTFIPPRGTK